MAKLKGKTAIVTGGAMGIGLATARLLLKEKCIVTIWDTDRDSLELVKQELDLNNEGRIFTYECDVTDNRRIKELTDQAVSDMGRIDILINNAGIEKHGRFCEKPISDWLKVMDVNINSVFYTTHTVLPHMYSNNTGHIVNISSAAGTVGVADLAAYCASKWAVWGFTESLKLEVITDKKNIRLSSVHPNFIKKGLFAGCDLTFFGRLLVPGIKNHDVVAKAIVKKALRKKRNTVKIPVTVHIACIVRALFPDFIHIFLAGRVFGVDSAMDNWVGHKGRKNL